MLPARVVNMEAMEGRQHQALRQSTLCPAAEHLALFPFLQSIHIDACSAQ